MIRGNETYNYILNSRRLFQKFLVDTYDKVAERNGKSYARKDTYTTPDAIINEENIEDIGTIVRLPSSYIGSPRHMHEFTRDATTYVRKYG